MSTKKNTNMSPTQVEVIRPMLEACGVEVINLVSGEVTCPGIDLHTTDNAFGDCMVFEDNGEFPHLHCFHESCRSVRKLIDNKLREAVTIGRNASCGPAELATARLRQQAHEAKRAAVEHERNLAASWLPDVLRDYKWSAESMVIQSQAVMKCSVHEHWLLLISLFDDDDVIWIGRDKYDSGSPGHRWRFRPVCEWLTRQECPGILTCPSTFRPGVYQRFESHVLTPKFLVVESDTLTRDQVGAVFRWIEEAHNLPLRAVVDTGNKSLHGWFEYPVPSLLEKLRLWLPAMGCDEAMFTPNQACKMPGILRPDTEVYQRLIYFA